MSADVLLKGERYELTADDSLYPQALALIARPPRKLFVVGDPHALREGLAVIGARKATPYGRGCARRFASIAAERGIVIISGGARGCDAAAHEAALEVGGKTVVFLGGGCDRVYPFEHKGLFQRVVDAGGAVVSEQPWECDPRPYMFRERNRLIAGLARATLIVEAGLPSGTFSTADEALAANRDVLVVPGSITSVYSRGANRLIYQGATPVVDEETFGDQLFDLFGCLRYPWTENREGDGVCEGEDDVNGALLESLRAEPLGVEELVGVARLAFGEEDVLTRVMVWLAKAQSRGLIAQYPDGRYGPAMSGSPSPLRTR